MDMLSDGELYRMQQEAIQRARATARQSTVNSPNENRKQVSLLPNSLGELFNFKSNDSLIIMGVLFLLLADGCDDKLLLLALIFLLLKK